MYVCVHVHIHLLARTGTAARANLCTPSSVCVCVRENMQLCVSVWGGDKVNACVRVCACVRLCVCVNDREREKAIE